MRSKEKNMDLTSTENEAAKKVKKADKWADKPAMEVRDLHFSYGKNKVLKGVSLKIEEGKITTIMGANGCGKSTLFSLMTKNLYPRKGNIFLKGKNIQNLNLKEFARKVAIVQQYNSASDDITVENLVAFGRTPHKKMMQGDSAEDERMIQWALEVTNLTEYRDREVSRLSYKPGMKPFRAFCKAEQRCHIKGNRRQDRKDNSDGAKSKAKKPQQDPEYFQWISHFLSFPGFLSRWHLILSVQISGRPPGPPSDQYHKVHECFPL